MNRAFRFLCVSIMMLLATCLLSSVYGRQKMIPVPSWADMKIESPDGKGCLIHKAKHRKGGGNTTQLWYQRKPKSKPVSLLAYQRSIAVLWSEKGDAVLLNEHMGSNLANCYVVLFRNGIVKYDMGRLLNRKPCERVNHSYIDGIEWVGNKAVKIKAWGDCLAKDRTRIEYETVYLYQIGEGFTVLQSK